MVKQNANGKSTVIFGTNWSLETWDVRHFFDNLEVPYEYRDIESDDDARVWLETHSDGAIPTLLLPHGELLTTPTQFDLDTHYRDYLPAEQLKRKTRPIPRMQVDNKPDD